MSANRMEGECQVLCRDCNGYLWSGTTVESNGKTHLLIACPYKKDSRGKCTGVAPKENR